MKDSFSMRGQEEILAKLECLRESTILSAASPAVKEGLNAICAEAKALCPRDTGTLADSLAVRDTADGGEVYASLPYAVPVEIGTRGKTAQPFLFPAMRIHEQQAAQSVCSAVLRQIREEVTN